MFGSKKHQESNITILCQEPINSIIGEGLTIQGDIKGDGTIRIDGVLEGNVSAQKGVIIGDTAYITGDIKTESLIVYGRITGNIYCKSIQIKNSGIIKGEIFTDVILIETGGKYNGQLHMREDKEVIELSNIPTEPDTKKKRLA